MLIVPCAALTIAQESPPNKSPAKDVEMGVSHAGTLAVGERKTLSYFLLLPLSFTLDHSGFFDVNDDNNYNYNMATYPKNKADGLLLPFLCANWCTKLLCALRFINFMICSREGLIRAGLAIVVGLIWWLEAQKFVRFWGLNNTSRSNCIILNFPFSKSKIQHLLQILIQKYLLKENKKSELISHESQMYWQSSELEVMQLTDATKWQGFWKCTIFMASICWQHVDNIPN